MSKSLAFSQLFWLKKLDRARALSLFTSSLGSDPVLIQIFFKETSSIAADKHFSPSGFSFHCKADALGVVIWSKFYAFTFRYANHNLTLTIVLQNISLLWLLLHLLIFTLIVSGTMAIKQVMWSNETWILNNFKIVLYRLKQNITQYKTRSARSY